MLVLAVLSIAWSFALLVLGAVVWRQRKKKRGLTKEVKGVIAFAGVVARKTSAPATDACHLLMAMACGDAGRVRLAARKLDATALVDGLTPLLFARRGAAPYKDSLSDAGRLLFRRAASRSGEPVGVDALLDASLAEPSFAGAVSEARRAYAGASALDDALPAAPTSQDGPADIVFHNDDKTTAEVVLHVLKTTFGKDDLEAFRLMFMTHHTGLARLGPYARQEAERLTGEALRYARANGAPLRIEVEARGDPMAWGG